MSNEALWRSGDDEIIPAPASVIVVPRPMELAPDVQRPADGQREVVQEEAIASDVAAEVVVGEERAVREGTVEDVVRGEAVADESSGSWREIEEIDICEPLSSMGEEGISHLELSAEEATEESSGSRHVEVVGMDEPPVPAGGMGASHSDGLEVGCARVLSVEEYRERRLRNTTRREVRSGVATFVATSGTDCTMTPVIPEIVEEDTRRVVPRGDVGSTCRKSRSRKRKSHSQGRERSQSRQRSGADSSSDTGRVIRKVAPDEKQRANNDKCETATEGDTRRVVPRGDVGSTCRKSSSKKRRSSSHRRSQSPRGRPSLGLPYRPYVHPLECGWWTASLCHSRGVQAVMATQRKGIKVMLIWRHLVVLCPPSQMIVPVARYSPSCQIRRRVSPIPLYPVWLLSLQRRVLSLSLAGYPLCLQAATSPCDLLPRPLPANVDAITGRVVAVHVAVCAAIRMLHVKQPKLDQWMWNYSANMVIDLVSLYQWITGVE